jgi:hypothetical protein
MTFEACAPLSLFAIFPRGCAKRRPHYLEYIKMPSCKADAHSSGGSFALLLAGARMQYLLAFFRAASLADCNNNAC